MLHELSKAVEEFDTVSDDKLGYFEEEILGFAFFADGEIKIETNYYLETPYVSIGNQNYKSDARVKANYRSGLAQTIRKGFVDQWCGNSFLLTEKGWNKAEYIVEDIKRSL
ncbi:MAG: hypothetical protein CI947_1257 [Halanaerobium sp.]|jgi:hypothetical protein|nr:MAG: hypothetical protein CI947_1257 [Halanaerobium sp.]